MVANADGPTATAAERSPRARGVLPAPRHAPRIPRRVRIVEVGPRDGLQNEAVHVPADAKVALVNDLLDAGMRSVEVTAFVSRKRVPQLADAAPVMRALRARDAHLLALVPNMRGLNDALAAGARHVAVLAAATDAFSLRNVGVDVDDALARYADVVARARARGVRCRAYVSCALGCPYEGDVAPAKVARVAKALYALGCYEIALGDTIGAGNPRSVVDVVAAVVRAGVPVDCVAVHFHDTRGAALANVLAALSVGVSVVDASIAGLGGCPFAPGSAGNLATEDLVNMLQGMRIDVGDIDLERLVRIGQDMCERLGCENRSRVAVTMLNAAKRDKL